MGQVWGCCRGRSGVDVSSEVRGILASEARGMGVKYCCHPNHLHDVGKSVDRGKFQPAVAGELGAIHAASKIPF